MYLEDESHSYHISTGSIVINKDGEFVTDTTLMKGYWYDFIFNFFKDSLAGVTFDVYAKEDIVSADGLDTVYHKAGDKVATIVDRKSTRLNSSHTRPSRMPSSA